MGLQLHAAERSVRLMWELSGIVWLIMLHGPDGRTIMLNPATIASMRSGIPGTANALVHGEVRCVISTIDGKLVNVVETCEIVRDLIRGGVQ